MKPTLLAITLLLVHLGPSTAVADSGSIRTPLTISGTDLDARGTVSGTFGTTRSTMTVAASKLDPSASCEFVVDGIVEGVGTSSRTGALTLRFRAPNYRGYQRLDFDPRGKSMQLKVNGATVLSGVFSGNGEDPKTTVSELARLKNQVSGSKSRASATYTRNSAGVATFSVAVTSAPIAPITLVVNGQPEAQPIVVGRTGSGVIRYRSSSSSSGFLPMQDDPRGATIDLIQNGQSMFTGQMLPQAFGANLARRNAVILPIPAVTQPPVGFAKAKWSVDERARRKFSVELENAPVGGYDLLVNGVAQGIISVVNFTNGTKGELEFSSSNDDSTELPLTFDPLGATIAIAQGGVTLFQSVYDPTTLSTRPRAEPSSELEEFLGSTGIISFAKAEAKYEVDSSGRHRFKVEIEDVPVGTYSLRVGSVHRASIRAALINGRVEGEVEFRSVVEPRKILLNFDPRGQLIEVISPEGAVLFTHLFGNGSATGGNGSGTDDNGSGSGTDDNSGGNGGNTGGNGGNTSNTRLPVFISQALFAQSGSLGSVLATYEVQDDGDIKLKLKARQLALGSYDVSVGGVSRGILNVVISGGQTEGELEFENDPDPGQPLLNFAVLGQEIVVSRNGNTLFSRILTNP